MVHDMSHIVSVSLHWRCLSERHQTDTALILFVLFKSTVICSNFFMESGEKTLEKQPRRVFNELHFSK